jgi:hypothetical protein
VDQGLTGFPSGVQGRPSIISQGATDALDSPSKPSAGMTLNSFQQQDRFQGRMDPPFESPGQLALIAIVVWLVGAFVHPLAILAPVGFVLLLVAGAAYLARPKKHTMYWRGRELDLGDDRAPAQRLYRMLFRH